MAAIFIASGTAKLPDLQTLRRQLESLVGRRLPAAFAGSMAALELGCAVALVAPWAWLARIGLALSGLWLATAAIVLVRSRRGGRTLACGCFGMLADASNSRGHAVADAALGAMGLAAAALGPDESVAGAELRVITLLVVLASLVVWLVVAPGLNRIVALP